MSLWQRIALYLSVLVVEIPGVAENEFYHKNTILNTPIPNLTFFLRVVSTGKGTDAVVRVLIESGDGESNWSTVGVSENIVEASWKALVDSINYKLLKDEAKRAREARI